jgi:hypothetical protein
MLFLQEMKVKNNLFSSTRNNDYQFQISRTPSQILFKSRLQNSFSPLQKASTLNSICNVFHNSIARFTIANIFSKDFLNKLQKFRY